jgi:hypothetical protein
MAKRAPNPNTAYGRKRLREEHQQWRANITPQEREKSDNFAFWGVLIVLAIIVLIVFLIGGTDGVLHWFTK